MSEELLLVGEGSRPPQGIEMLYVMWMLFASGEEEDD